MRFADIPRPYPRSQSVNCVIGLLEQVLMIFERHCGHHRAENFLPHYLHVVVGIDQDSRFDKVAFVALALATNHCFCSLSAARLEIAANPVELFF